MIFNQNWKAIPKEGHEFIYRYYDNEGKSYIGHTKRSLCDRAGGKNGRNYTRKFSKFQEAIIKNGFESFEFEILEEVPAEEVEVKEKHYINKFDSREDGYNSTYGGRAYYDGMSKQVCVINLNKYTESQLRNLKNNIITYGGIKTTEEQNLDQLIKDSEDFTDTYYYYAFEGEELEIECPFLATVFNFIDAMIEKTWSDYVELLNEMRVNECLGGDLLTSGEDSFLDIILSNNERISVDLRCIHPRHI